MLTELQDKNESLLTISDPNRPPYLVQTIMSDRKRVGASAFDHALDADFIDKLAAEARKEGWWADVLADPTLLIAPRGNYLNVYWRGQSLFCVKSIPSGFQVTTHEKFLLDPKLASQVSLKDGKFEIASLVEKGFISQYEGPKTLAEMKTSAGLFSGLEKTGCHEIAVRNFGVIDVEIAFPGKVSLDDGSADKWDPRVDLTSLETTEGNKVGLVFWEAKHFSNRELRANDGLPPVLHQVDIYKKYLSDNRKAIESSYTKVAKNLVSLSDMGWKRQISPLINDAAKGKLTLGEEPKVGLIIFGFGSAERDDAGWQDHLERLKNGITHVRAVGEAKKIYLPA
jgi:hypothetical protein